MISDAKQLLKAHDVGPPFTMQRLAELLLMPNKQYPPTQEHKYLLALTRVLNVASSAWEFEDIDIIGLSEERERQAEERERLEREREEELNAEDDFPFPLIGAQTASVVTTTSTTEAPVGAGGEVTSGQILFGTVEVVQSKEDAKDKSENPDEKKKTEDEKPEESATTPTPATPISSHETFPLIARPGLRSRNSSVPPSPSQSSGSIVDHLNSVVVMSPITWINGSGGDSVHGKTLMEELAEANSLLESKSSSTETENVPEKRNESEDVEMSDVNEGVPTTVSDSRTKDTEMSDEDKTNSEKESDKITEPVEEIETAAKDDAGKETNQDTAATTTEATTTEPEDLPEPTLQDKTLQNIPQESPNEPASDPASATPDAESTVDTLPKPEEALPESPLPPSQDEPRDEPSESTSSPVKAVSPDHSVEAEPQQHVAQGHKRRRLSQVADDDTTSEEDKKPSTTPAEEPLKDADPEPDASVASTIEDEPEK